MTEDPIDSALTFPCLFPIKAMGIDIDDFSVHVRNLVARHVSGEDLTAIDLRASRGGRYLSVTVTIRASSRAQLDAIYRDLSADPRVVFAL